MSKEEIALEILKLCAAQIIEIEWKEHPQDKKKADHAGRLAQAYNAIYAAISAPQGKD